MKQKSLLFFTVTLCLIIPLIFSGCTNYWMEHILGKRPDPTNNNPSNPIDPNDPEDPLSYVLRVIVPAGGISYSGTGNYISPLFDTSGYSEREAALTIEVRGFANNADAGNVKLNIPAITGLDFNNYNDTGSVSNKVKTFTLEVGYNDSGNFTAGIAAISISLINVPDGYTPRNAAPEINIKDGKTENSTRRIPVTDVNIGTLIEYANTAEGLKRHYLQTGDIILPNVEMGVSNWTAIGDLGHQFIGSYDGGNKAISNLKLVANGAVNQGMFGYIGEEGKVSNVTLDSLHIEGDSYNAGGIAGTNDGTVEYCSISGDIEGDSYVGGVAGDNWGTIDHCSYSGDLTGQTNFIGGVAGRNEDQAVISNCSSDGTVLGISSAQAIGGIAGDSFGTITGCRSSASAKGNNNVGGVVGNNHDGGTVEKCHAVGNSVIANSSNGGGIAGNNSGQIYNSYSEDTVIADGNAGGIAGENSGQIHSCYSKDNVNANTNAGGITGENHGTIEKCYATGNIIADSIAGGIAGYSDVTIKCCFQADGDINSAEYAGGVVGFNASGIVENCYATGDVTVTRSSAQSNRPCTAGGVAGYNNGTVEYCYAIGNVIADNASSDSSYAGGVAGHNSATVKNCVALNYTVSAITTAVSGVGRVAYSPLAESVLQNNYARFNMLCSWSVTPDKNSDDGAHVYDNSDLSEDYRYYSLTWWDANTNGPGFNINNDTADNTVWGWNSNHLPILKGFPEGTVQNHDVEL